MAILKINGVDMPDPSSFSVSIMDLDSEESRRNILGKLNRDRVAVKRKLNCEWGPLTMSQISTLLNAVKDEFFQVTYPDPFVGGEATKTFYVGDRQMPMYSKVNGQILWEGLKMNFIER